MTHPVLLCTDGSDLALGALAAGLAVLGPDAELAVVTVMHEPDPSLVTGTGFAGGVVSSEEFDAAMEAAGAVAAEIVTATQQALGLSGGPFHVLTGSPGPAICQLATDLSAQAVVLGSQGRGGLKRAVLGSVSDHVVRNAPCPVVVTGPHAVTLEPS
jgi:nucleotide-binding universal stress UspA family protein